MSEPEQSNHWASLADKLGIDADTSAARSRHHDPSPEQLSRPPKRSASPPPPRQEANWDEVASQLGIAPTKQTETRDEEPRTGASIREDIESADATFEDSAPFDVEIASTSGHELAEAPSDEGDASPVDVHDANGPADDDTGERKPGRRRRRRRRRKPTEETAEGEPEEAQNFADAVVEDEREDERSDSTTTILVDATTEAETDADGEDEEEEEGRPRRRRRRRRRRRKDTNDAAADETSSHLTVADQSVAAAGLDPDDEELSFANLADSFDTLDEPDDADERDDADESDDADDADDADEVTSKGTRQHDDEPLRKKPHKNIPTWADALSALIERNLESRSRNPDPSASAAPGRGRGRRGRGRAPKKK